MTAIASNIRLTVKYLCGSGPLIYGGIAGPCFICGANDRDVVIDGRVTCQVPRWAWQEAKGAVNEADYITVGPEERQRRCELWVWL